jgi:hypothetical protein
VLNLARQVVAHRVTLDFSDVFRVKRARA